MDFHRARVAAGAFTAQVVPPRRTLIGFPAQKMTALRDGFGGLADVACLILTDPGNAYRYGEYVMSLVREVASLEPRCLRLMLNQKSEADAAEDIARDRLRDVESVETIDRAIAAVEQEVARGQELLDGLRQRRAELLQRP